MRPAARSSGWVRRALLVLVVFLAALVLVIAGAVWWLAGSERGLHWALERARSAAGPSLTIEGAEGSLASAVTIARLVHETETRVIEAHGIRIEPALAQLAAGALHIERLHVDRVVVRMKDVPEEKPSAGPPTLPADLGLPLRVRIDRASVDRTELLRGAAEYVFADLRFAYAGGPAQHAIPGLAVTTPAGPLALEAMLDAGRPFRLEAAVTAPDIDAAAAGATGPAARLAGHVSVQLTGSLENLRAQIAGVIAGVTTAVDARLTPFAATPLAAIDLQAATIDLATFAPEWPRTALRVQIAGESRQRGVLTGTLAVRNERAGPLDAKRVPLAALNTRFVTDFSAAELTQLVVDLQPGGRLSGSAHLQRPADNVPPFARLNLQATALDLRALRSTLRATRLSGPLQIAAGREQQSITATFTQDDMQIHAEAVRRGDEIDVPALRLAARGGTLSAHGRVALGKATRIAGDLRLARFDPAAFGNYPAGRLNGSARIEGALGADSRRGSARWTIADSMLSGVPVASTGRATFDGQGGRQRLTGVEANARLGANRLIARGAFGTARDELAWTLEAPQLAQVARAIDRAPALAGRLVAQGTLVGTFSAPRLAVEARGERLQLPGNVSVLRAQLQAAGGTAPEAPFDIDLTASDVAARNIFAERLSLQSEGTRAAHSAALQATSPHFDLETRVQGGWSQAAGWSGTLTELRNRGDYPLELLAPAKLEVAPPRFGLADLQLRLADGEVRVEQVRWADGALTSRGAFSALPVQWLLALAGREQMQATAHLAGEWSIESTPRLNGRMAVRRTDGDILLADRPKLALGLERAELTAVLAQSRIDARVDLVSKLGTLHLEGNTGPAPGATGIGITPQSPLALSARIDLASLRLLTGMLLTIAQADGRLSADLSGRGTLGAPQLSGSVRGSDLSFDMPPYGVYLRDGRLRAALTGDRVQVEEFVIAGGDGRFTATGSLPLQFAAGTSALRWNAEQFRLLGRPDLQLVVSGGGSAGFERKRFRFSGDLRAERGVIEIDQRRLPDLGADVIIVGRETAPAQQGEPRAPLALDVRLDLGNDLTVRGYGFNGEVAGRVHLTTNAEGELRAEGKVTAVDATFIAYGQRLDVDPGVLFFNGPPTNPSLQITALRRNQPVRAGVEVSGTVQLPRVELISEPAVSEGEKLSWLVLGRAPSDATTADLALLQTAVGFMLGGRSSGTPLNRRLAQTVGLDEIALRNSTELESRVVAFGKRLSDRLYVTYEQGVGTAAENLVKLDYSLTRRIALRAEAGGSTGAGVIYRFSWD